jgi:hypothetical protein
MNLGGCGHGAPPSTETARTDPVSRSSISRPMVTQELGFPYPCSLAVSPWRLPGGEAPLGSNRIAPDLWGFPWVSHLPSQSPSGLLALLPFHSISALPGHPPSLSSASSHNPLTSLDCPALYCRSSGFYPPLCYQASQALSPQYYTQICHPLSIPQLGSLPSRVRFMTPPGTYRSQNRRSSPGKIAPPPHIPSKFTSVRFAGYQDSLSHACSPSSPQSRS